MRNLILLFGIICSFLSGGLSEAFAALADDIEDSTTIIRQNTRTLERAGDFASQCTDKVKSDPSLVSICDSLLQKFNIDMGKFYVENQFVVEELIYPYTLPSNIDTSLDSANVLGSDDPLVAADHGSTTVSYLEPISDISEECASRARSYDMSGIKECMGLMESLNSHLKVFNQNSRSEFDRVLNTVP